MNESANDGLAVLPDKTVWEGTLEGDTFKPECKAHDSWQTDYHREQLLHVDENMKAIKTHTAYPSQEQPE